jgi:alpha-tubulin suppressor-like RCC1 family protein
LLLALSACSLLVGDGDYAVGKVDAGATLDAPRGDTHTGPRVVAVSAANLIQTWCALASDGAVWCWGDNTFGQLGDGATAPSATPMHVMGLPHAAIQISVGATTVCAVLEDGAAWCWGNGQTGQLGNGTTSGSSSTPVPVTGLGSHVSSLSSGYAAACAAKDDGTVWCWGTLGAADFTGPFLNPNPTPVQIGGLPPVKTVAVGLDTACVISTKGAVLCWGDYMGSGTLGNGSYNGSETPVEATGVTGGVTSLSVAMDTCVVTGEATVECWGQNFAGQLGNYFVDDNSAAPVKIQGLTGRFVAVSTGDENVCALREDGSVWCWGAAADGQLGDGLASLEIDAGPNLLGPESRLPVKVEGLSSAAALLSGGDAPCVLTSTGSVECWGYTCEWAASPRPVTNDFSGATYSSLSLGGSDADSSAFACVVAKQGTDDTVLCWGSNLDGQLGNGTDQSSTIPARIGSGALDSSAASVSAGESFGCGISSGSVLCWGDNHVGQLGGGTTIASKTPVKVEGLSSPVAQVSAGATVACAVTTDGAALCWGDNSVGQLGTGSTGAPSLKAVPTMLTSGVRAVSAGYDFVCALLTTGTVDCWGDNATGQLGNGNTNNTATPTAVVGLSGVVSVSAGVQFACAATAGSIECWGFGGNCQFGDSKCQQMSATPVPVNQLSGASQVAAGLETTCAIVKGAAYCWGMTAIGNSFFSPIDYAETPVPVDGLDTGVTDIAVGGSSACAIVNDIVQCWGANSAGQLGNRGAVNELVATTVKGLP